VFDNLNRMPEALHGADVTRVRQVLDWLSCGVSIVADHHIYAPHLISVPACSQP
jgi:hypothetical protein